MAITPTDERDLLLPLYTGMRDSPPWDEFLRRLAYRTGAERAGLFARGPNGRRTDWWSSGRAAQSRPQIANPRLDAAALSAVMRPHRVFTLDEVLDLLDRETRAEAAINRVQTGTAFVRAMRVPFATGFEGLVLLEHGSEDFTAAAGALLSSLAPHLAAALDLARDFDELRARSSMAEQALASLGVSQALLDGTGRVVVADDGRLGPFRAQAGAALPRTGPAGQRLGEALDRIGAGATGPEIVPDEAWPERTLLVRPAPPSGAILPVPGATVALTRATPADDAPLVALLEQLHHLSRREAELALALCRGLELVPAGLDLGLTPETTRNYSKRIYAKTGTRGQADLVRLVLTGLAPFAADAPRAA